MGGLGQMILRGVISRYPQNTFKRRVFSSTRRDLLSLSTAAMGILFYKFSLAFALIDSSRRPGIRSFQFLVNCLYFCSVRSYRGFWQFQLASTIPLHEPQGLRAQGSGLKFIEPRLSKAEPKPGLSGRAGPAHH